MTGSGPRNCITDVSGIRVGHHGADWDGWLTGVTVVLAPPGTVGGVDVRGGGPCTRETDALAPTTLVGAVHAICLSGGSAYGLSAASGVADWLGERGTGLRVGDSGAVVPIVAGACLFDLGAGGDWTKRPDASWGRAAAEAAAGPAGDAAVAEGNVGAGIGARAGGLKGGIGSASVVVAGGATVAALAAVNAAGSAVDPVTGALLAAPWLLPGEVDLPAPHPLRLDPSGVAWSDGEPRTHTILAVVATDVALNKPECTRLAMAGHDGIARSVRPAHGMTDGDVVYSLATASRAMVPPERPGLLREGDTRPLSLGPLLSAAADTVARSIARALLAAASAGGVSAYRQALDTAEGAERRE